MSPSQRREVRDTFARRGLRPHKSRGQNFLVDPRVAERIVAGARLGPGDAVIEVGPGLGILTRALAARAERVVAIEIDRGLVETLRSEGELPGHVALRHDDALGIDLSALVAELGRRTHVVANLPYAISAPLLRWLLGAREALASWVVMLQREVAERLVAPVGARQYGSLSVLTQTLCEVERLFAVPNAAFDPVPQVESVVVRALPRAPSPLDDDAMVEFERVVRACFSARRKTLVNALRGQWPWGIAPERSRLEGHLEAQGIAVDARAETLSPGEFAALVTSLRGDFVA